MTVKAFIKASAFTLLFILLSAALCLLAGFSAADKVKEYSNLCYSIERGFIENVPLYRDFATTAQVAELRKFNLAAHAKEVVKTGIKPMHNVQDIMVYVKDGRLKELNSEDELFYFYNVQKQYRYLTPGTIKGLMAVTERFQEKIKAYKIDLPDVKIAISSVIRTVNYQEKIFGRKFVSTHSYGGCFDIYYEDYFVSLPEQKSIWPAEKKILSTLHTRFGFLLGDSLREQFRTILMQTLLELQREGVLYAYLEDDNKCYHVTILVK